MPYLQSHTIEAVVYDERDHLLKTKFRADGKVMIYEDVPQEVYDSLIFADSISEFFQENIVGAYRAREVFPSAGTPGSSSLAASHSRSRATANNRAR
ncbi:MAG: KTSC domain-containing protein [Pseudomonadota bacterium]